MLEWFWFVIVITSILWYGFLVFYVGWKGFYDIVDMVKALNRHHAANQTKNSE